MIIGALFRLLCGGLFFLIILAAIVALVLLLARNWSRPAAGSQPVPYTPETPAASESSRALEILKERYARGEITKEEYESMRRDLTS